MFVPLFHTDQRFRDQVVREEVTKDELITNINKVITAMEELFATCKTFFLLEPTEEVFDGCVMAYGDGAFSQALNATSLTGFLKRRPIRIPG